jgi:hypothetical protein
MRPYPAPACRQSRATLGVLSFGQLDEVVASKEVVERWDVNAPQTASMIYLPATFLLLSTE